MINQDQVLQLRTRIPEEQLPIHVTGGIPIQQYLSQLLERMPNLPADDVFVLVDSGPRTESATRSSHSSLNSLLENSAVFRQAFLDDYIEWTARHERVRVEIPGVERPCYVWQSMLQAPSLASTEEDTGSDVAPHELNIPVREPAPPATMFNR